MKFDLNNFQIMGKQSFGGKRAARQPFVGINKHGITFNTYIGKHYAFVHQKYAQVFIDSAAQKLAVVFFDKFDPNSFKVTQLSKSDGTQISTATLCKHLTENAELINTNVFRYKFMPEIDNEQQIIMIDLKNPFFKNQNQEVGDRIMTKQFSVTKSLIAHARSQKDYIDHLPVRELMNRSKHTINPFDTLDDYKFLMMSRDASITAICGGVAYDTAD